MIKRSNQKLSERQIAILSYIHAYQTENGFAPTIREIARAVDMRSTSAVSYQIRRLVELGYISKVSDISRGMLLRPEAYDAIAAQAPIDEDFATLQAQVSALQIENQRIREFYEQRISSLQHECDRLLWRLNEYL